MTIKVLTFSSLYPNNVNATFGVFVETRLRELIKNTDIESFVVAPVPSFMGSQKFRNVYAHYSSAAIVCILHRKHSR